MSRSGARAGSSAPIRLARGSGALIVLTGLMVGVPWALVHFVGMPVPSALPTLDGLRRSIEQTGVGEGAVVKAVAVVVWIAWSRLAVAVAVDLAASLSRRPLPRLAMLGSSQRIVGGMVASVMLMFGVVRPGAVIAGSVPRPAAPVVAGAVVTGTTASSDPGTGPASIVIGRLPWPAGASLTTEPDAGGRFERESATREVPSVVTWTVRRNDSFWRIAEQSLGDGRRWPEVVRANVGREVAPGLVFTEQTEAIHPGWVLVLPPIVSDGSAGAPSMVEVRPGDSLVSIAEAVYGAGTEWTTVWESNRERRFGDRVFDDPNLIQPGWQLFIPDDPSPVVAQPDPVSRRVNSVRDVAATVACAPDVVSSPGPLRPPAAGTAAGATSTGDLVDASSRSERAPSVVAGSVSPATPAPAQTARVVEGASREDPTEPIGLAGAGLLATGVLGLLTARRRAALRSSHAGDRLADLAQPLIRLEREIRLVADVERLARLDLAVRVAHRHLIEAPVAGRLIGAIVHPCGTVVLDFAADPLPLSPPFVQGPDDRWTLPGAVPLESVGADVGFGAFPCPALVQLGRCGASDVYLDLEAVGLLVIDGPAPAVDAAILRSIAVALTVSPFAEQAQLITCGVTVPRLDGGIATSSVESADEAIDLAAELLSPVLGALRPGRTTAELRHRSAGEAWEPAIVVIGAPLLDPGVAGELAEALPSLCSPPGRGLAVVTDARIAASSRLTAGDEGWLLTPLDLVIQPVGLSGPVVETLAELVSPAVHVVERRAPDLNRASTIVAELVTVRAMPFVEPDWALMLRTLGPVDLVDRAGTAAPFGRSKALELVAWLVDHRETATRRGARAALWESEVQDATFANVVSDARRTLARLCAPPDGEEWIARSLDERLAIHRRLVSDVELLRARIVHARAEPAGQATSTLRSGLELVRDAPFVASDYLWPDAEGTASQVMLTVTEAATMMAEQCLALGDPVGVFWATGKGMLAVPGHEELISLRMRAHASTGDLAGVRTEWASYERVLHADRWSAAEPAPKLLELRRQLLGPRLAP